MLKLFTDQTLLSQHDVKRKPKLKVIQTILLRLLNLILILSLACLWVILSAKPALT